MIDVIKEIAAERQRQISVEGWTPEHDDEHALGELATVAACYALKTTGYSFFSIRDYMWPKGWSRKWFKPKDSRRDLIRAAALIVAEIDRLDRLAARAVAAQES